MFKAENPEPLVSGVTYNASSFASFKLIVTDVNEAPVFSQDIFQAEVREDVAIGTKLGNVTARDPEGLDVRYKTGLGQPHSLGQPQLQGMGREGKAHWLQGCLLTQQPEADLWPRPGICLRQVGGNIRFSSS